MTKQLIKTKAVLNIPIDRLHDYSMRSIREFVMENDYADHLKKILPEIEFTKHIVKDDMFKIQMIHESFPAAGEMEEYLNYSMGNGFIYRVEDLKSPVTNEDPYFTGEIKDECFFCNPKIFDTHMCKTCVDYHKEYVWSGKLETYAVSCCTYPPGGFCAGGEKQALKSKVKQLLEDEKKEYNGDNVILALFDMNYIDYDKMWNK